jgi:hypothetical protein
MNDAILKEVIARYRTSGDFNGLHFRLTRTPAERDAASALIRGGLVEVVSEKDYPNPHIRPWPTRRSIDEQVADVKDMPPESYGVCLYPTAEALRRNRTRRKYPDQPYRQAMADGRGTLELRHFETTVLEQYRNDPRLLFQYSDFGVNTVISDEAYRDDEKLDKDKIIMSHIGFAYDLSGYDAEEGDSPIIRRVCAFYGDLAKLSAEHQQRWKTYDVVPQEGLWPQPAWMDTQMGRWADGVGPFGRFMYELEALNELQEMAFGTPGLFLSTEKPREFGWILRASQSEWDQFIHQLDKLLSENLSSEALDKLGAAKVDNAGENLGTLSRLEVALVAKGNSSEVAKRVMAPLREVRSARQRPAHALRTNITDRTFVHKQVDLMGRINQSLIALRTFWQSHPANAAWSEAGSIAEGENYRM